MRRLMFSPNKSAFELSAILMRSKLNVSRARLTEERERVYENGMNYSEAGDSGALNKCMRQVSHIDVELGIISERLAKLPTSK